MAKQFTVFLIALLLTSKVIAGTAEWSQGVADFLLDRAHANYIYLFEKSLREDQYFACYMPRTRQVLDVGSLNELLSLKAVWKAALLKDIEVLSIRSIATTSNEKAQFSNAAVDLAGAYIELLQKFEISYQGQWYALTYIDPDYDPELKMVINGLTDGIAAIVNGAYAFKDFSIPCDANSPASSPKDLARFKQAIKGLLDFDNNVKQVFEQIQAQGRSLRMIKNSDDSQCNDTSIACFEHLSKKLYKTKMGENKYAVLKNYAQQVNRKIIVLEKQSIAAQDKADLNNASSLAIDYISQIRASGYFENLESKRRKLSRHIMFFAQLGDAEGREVKVILETYTLPAVSFFQKREPGNHFFITSYLGYAFGRVTDEPQDSHSNNEGIYAPIGFEFSRGLESGSISLMLSPFDFGYPISLKLNGLEETVEFKEVVAPSLAISFGFKDLPIVVGSMFQKGRLSTITNRTQDRVMLFVGFDMPLLPLR